METLKKKMGNVLKCNNKNWRHSGVFVVNFEQVNVSWVSIYLSDILIYYYLLI